MNMHTHYITLHILYPKQKIYIYFFSSLAFLFPMMLSLDSLIYIYIYRCMCRPCFMNADFFLFT